MVKEFARAGRRREGAIERLRSRRCRAVRTISPDADTGGSLLYISPHALFDVGGGWVLRAFVQVPLSQGGLNGQQEEKAVIGAGVTYLFRQ